jgi:hypothetical protein
MTMWSLAKTFPIRFTIAAFLVFLVVSGLLFALNPDIERTEAQQRKEAALGNEGVRARADLRELGELAARAQRRAKTTVLRITGSGCSDCACRTGDLRQIGGTTPCMATWLNVLKLLDAAAASSGAVNKYARDPWGSPYAIDENQGEGGAAACRTADHLRSVGKDGKYGTDDDMIVSIPLAGNCP